MRRLHCRCGQRVFFDNHSCTRCSRLLAFDPASLSMESEETAGSGLDACANRQSAIRCNWLRDADEQDGRCLSCRSSVVIPMLSKRANRERWRKLETAKRRLIYDLLTLGLVEHASGLKFVFKEDRRTNPDVHEEHVNIGHAQGVVTINAAEADDVYREEMRVLNNEPYRTLLGHFRHEAGHYFFDLVVKGELLERSRTIFGDHSRDYEAALQYYYNNGPWEEWPQYHISAYASAHPAEDWAECFAHYLHIRALTETALASGFVSRDETAKWQDDFIELVIGINEIMRSLGLSDAYPFVLVPPVAEKINFVAEAIGQFTGQPA